MRNGYEPTLSINSDLIEQLKTQHCEEIEVQHRLEMELAASKDRVARYAQAVKALEPEAPKKQRKIKKAKKNDWQPKEQTLDRVLEYMYSRGSKDEVRVIEVMTSLNMSGQTARKSLEILRKRDKVRVTTGRVGRNGMKYAVMP